MDFGNQHRGILAFGIALLQVRVIAVEIENQRLFSRQWLGVSQAQVLFAKNSFNVRGVNRAAQAIVELVACTTKGQSVQATVILVAAFLLLGGEMTAARRTKAA